MTAGSGVQGEGDVYMKHTFQPLSDFVGCFSTDSRFSVFFFRLYFNCVH